jgi:hypothetical protein
MILYHITPTRNLSNVMKNGLVPKIGKRSKAFGEPKPAIYFFPDLKTVVDGIENWLAHEFSENARLSLLEITLPPDMDVYSDVGFERHVYEVIPPNCIKIITKDVMGEVAEDFMN